MPLVKNPHDIEVRNDDDLAVISKKTAVRLHYGPPGGKRKRRKDNLCLPEFDNFKPLAIHKNECRWCRFKKCYGTCKKEK